MSFHIEITAMDRASARAYIEKAATVNPHFTRAAAGATLAMIDAMQDHPEFGVKVAVIGHIPAEQLDYPAPAQVEIKVHNLWIVGKDARTLAAVEDGGTAPPKTDSAGEQLDEANEA